MSVQVWAGHGRHMVPVPAAEWQRHVAQAPEQHDGRLAFMTEDHRRVRTFAVKELGRWDGPLTPEFIARKCDLPLGRVQSILDDLEHHLFFIVRNDKGAVAWAFPVTVEPTPHQLTFGTGERLYGA